MNMTDWEPETADLIDSAFPSLFHPFCVQASRLLLRYNRNFARQLLELHVSEISDLESWQTYRFC